MHKIKGEINISVLKYNKKYIEKLFLNINSILIQKGINLIFNISSLNRLWSGFYTMNFECDDYVRLLNLFTEDKDILNVYHNNNLGYMKINMIFNTINTNAKNINPAKYYGNDYINIHILSMLSLDICGVDIMGEKKYIFTNIYSSHMESNARYNYCRDSKKCDIANNLFPEYTDIIKSTYEEVLRREMGKYPYHKGQQNIERKLKLKENKKNGKIN